MEGSTIERSAPIAVQIVNDPEGFIEAMNNSVPPYIRDKILGEMKGSMHDELKDQLSHTRDVLDAAREDIHNLEEEITQLEGELKDARAELREEEAMRDQ